MRILVAHNFYRSALVGGEDRVVVDEVAALKARLGDQNVLTYYTYNDQIQLLSLCKNIWGNRFHAQNIKALIEQHQVDILHVHNDFPLLTPLIFKVASQAGCIVLQSLHNFRPHCLSGVLFRQNKVCERCISKTIKWPGVLSRCYRGKTSQSLLNAMAQAWYRLRKYQSYVNYFFALSPFQKNKLISFGVQEDKIFLKPNFIKHQVEPKQASTRHGYIYIGRIEPGKGIEYLLKMWQDMPSQFVLKVVSAGESLEMLKAKYTKENIKFLGKLDHEQAMQELSQSKYLVHPSRYYETFGLTILEAMSLGVPVIGLNVGTRKDFIKHEENGLSTELDQLEGTILNSMAHPKYAQMCDGALAFSQAFSQEAIIDKQIELYEKILQGKSS